MTVQTRDPIHETERLNREGRCALILGADSHWFTMCGETKRYPKAMLCEKHLKPLKGARS